MLSELGLVDPDDACVEVDVAPVEADRLADPHARDRQQPEKGLVCRSPQGGPEGSRRVHQSGDVAFRVQVGRGSVAAAGEHVVGGHLGAGVEALKVAGEAADDAEPL